MVTCITDEVVAPSLRRWLEIMVDLGWASLGSDKGEYVNNGLGLPNVVDDGSVETRGASLRSPGADVILAGLLMVDLGDAGSVEITTPGIVGVTIDSASDNAMGGSQAPRQSKAQLAQAGSMLLT